MATAIALVVDGARMPLYAVTQAKEVLDIWPIVVVAIVAVLAGTLIGERLLRKIPAPVFRRIVALIIFLLGISMLYPQKS